MFSLTTTLWIYHKEDVGHVVGAVDRCAGDEKIRSVVRSHEFPSHVAVGVAMVTDDVSHDQLGPGG